MSAPFIHPALGPVRLGQLALANRVAVAPLSRVSTKGDGVPTSRMIDYYADYAKGGFGLIITEGTYPDSLYSHGYANQAGIANEAQVQGWVKVAAAVHAAGGKIINQLMHAGALSQHLKETIAPSAIRPKGRKMTEYVGEGFYSVPRAMTEADIEQVIEGFVTAAHRAHVAGFDGVEIHGANGYIIDQFLTPYTNLRTDRWGGDAKARARFGAEIVRQVRQAMPKDFVVGIRLSQGKVNDHHYHWEGGRKDGEAFFPAMVEAGADYIHVASEGRNYFDAADLGGITITKLARDLTGLPIIANGGMHDPDQARRILEEGHGDIVSLGRGAIANQDWPKRLHAGDDFIPFDAGMISPEATIENTDRWLREALNKSPC